MTQTALHRMIGAQADALDRIAGLDLDAPAAILAAARRVILVGTGTSQHAAELGAMMLEQAGADARWFRRRHLGAVEHRPEARRCAGGHHPHRADRVRRPRPGGRAGHPGCPWSRSRGPARAGRRPSRP